MPPYRKLDGRIALAQRLSDLSSLHFDLLHVELTCRRFQAEMKAARPDPLVISALCVAAIIRYGRTCNSGVRPAIPHEILSSLSPPLLRTHKAIKSLRDKWAAHSVNDMEETRVVIEVDGSMVVGVYEEHQNIGATSSSMRSLARLARALNKALGKQIQIERAALVEKLREMPAGSLRTIPRAAWSLLGRKPDKARSKW